MRLVRIFPRVQGVVLKNEVSRSIRLASLDLFGNGIVGVIEGNRAIHAPNGSLLPRHWVLGK